MGAWIKAMAAGAVLAASGASAGLFYNYDARHGDSRQAIEHAWLVRVRPGDKAWFYKYDSRLYRGCPAVTAACRQHAYVLPGDVLVAAHTVGAFTAVDFVSPRGAETEGAIETRLLEPVAVPAPPVSAWLGSWRADGEKTITIRMAKGSGAINVEGEATFGAYDPDRVARGAVNTGEMGGIVHPRGQWAGVVGELGSARKGAEPDWSKGFPYQGDKGSDCQVRLRLMPPYLLAEDDGLNCGGMNINFTAIYRQVPGRGR